MTVAADGLQPVSTDHFQIGDRVLVGGTKSGIIVFVGEVHFSTGEWAGVVLDTPTGKNDGKIGGHRYFMCEPQRGVFCRLGKLTKLSGAGGTVSLVESGLTLQPSDAMSTSLGDSRLTAPVPKNDSPNPQKAEVGGSSSKVADAKPPAVVFEKPSSPYPNTSSQQPDRSLTPSAKAESVSYSNGDDHMISRFYCFFASFLLVFMYICVRVR